MATPSSRSKAGVPSNATGPTLRCSRPRSRRRFSSSSTTLVPWAACCKQRRLGDRSPASYASIRSTTSAESLRALAKLLSTIAEPCRDAVDRKLDPTQHMLAGAARSVLLQALDLDVVQRVQVREPVAYRAIEQRIVLQEPAMIHHRKQGLDRTLVLRANALEDRLS